MMHLSLCRYDQAQITSRDLTIPDLARLTMKEKHLHFMYIRKQHAVGVRI